MLKSIQCNKFKNERNPEGIMNFSNGLNIICGDNEGDNSIGKSSLLMVIDFVFGGSDYVTNKGLRDIVDNVGDHQIYFTFAFNGDEYKFFRSTESPIYVYQILGNKTTAMLLDEYMNFLTEKYGLSYSGLNIHQIISRSVRIDNRVTLDTNRPLISYKNQSQSESVVELLKLFDKYKELEDINKQLNACEHEIKEFKSSDDHHFISMAKDKKQRYYNKVRMEQLKNQMEIIEKDNAPASVNLDNVNNKELSVQTHNLVTLRNRLDALNTRIRLIEDSLDTKKAVINDKDLAKLQYYFPDINIKPLQEIQKFHSSIIKIMKSEKAEVYEQYQTKKQLLERQIDLTNERIKKLKPIGSENVPVAIFDRYSQLSNEYLNLEKANSVADQNDNLKSMKNIIRQSYNNKLESQISELQREINDSMKKVNYELTNNNISAPSIELKNNLTYSFETFQDHGGNTKKLALILFDLALLQLTRLPVVIHDTDLTNSVSTTICDNLLKKYNSFNNKQIFIAMEKISTLSVVSKKIINGSKVCDLDLDHRLYNKAWNKTEN